MPNQLRRLESACMRRMRLREPAGFAVRASFWLLLIFLPAFLLLWLPGPVGTLAEVVALLTGLLLPWFLLVLGWRWVSRRLLWTVRNRIIVVCLLMGVAPVVLFGTLAAIAAYTFAGQFATDIALVSLNAQLERLHDRDNARAAALGHSLSAATEGVGARAETLRRTEGAAAQVETWVDAQRVNTGRPVGPLGTAGVPRWAQPEFSGVVESGGNLYLCAAASSMVAGHSVTALASLPLDRAEVQTLARGLGSIILYRTLSAPKAGSEIKDEDPNPRSLILVQGGDTGPPVHFFDRKVYFWAPLQVTDWQTGASAPATLGVVSRPSLLYATLFSSSVHIGTLVRDGLILITILFALLELLALLLAARLGRTLTRSIGDLYGATMEIDRGNLAYRVPVERPDQLGALATSFNTMAGSLAELLEQQREKQRMDGELAIAQEVQNNLFPDTPVHLPGFELHGVCQPARTVSGDYYDFILTPHTLCFALGDISGKGISAALLMATLHSAVRAYLAGEPSGASASTASQDEAVSMPSPGKLLGLLNHHLYSSTQPEKYATLFLACYDAATQRLTYSNGGHLTPFLMCADGRVERLACGGSVVGLLDGLTYPEATVQLHAGDMLIAYSDGMTEPENEFEEFGEERLVGMLRQSRHEPLPSLTAHLMRVLQQWIGDSEQPDDMTLVLARQL